jgi:DNA replication protein DnaC
MPAIGHEKDRCEACLGSGWVVEVEDGRRKAHRCDCVQKRRGERLLREAELPSRYDHCTFSGYEPATPTQKEALERAQYFVEAYPAVARGLLLLGRPGLGKTHLAVSALRELVLKKGVPGMFVDATHLMKRIQDSYNPGSGSREMEVLRPVQEAEVLVLDDLGGATPPSPWAKDTLFLILNARYNEQRPTIITSNYPDYERQAGDVRRYDTSDSLEDRIGERLRSRLYEMCDLVQLQGTDYRREAARKGFR